ncbi:MAG TPA: hypothetical protein VE378_04475 [Nitrososphaeraceae archaeon]|nr:hypothetical protein [Nitrososphaeraceae archaeon]
MLIADDDSDTVQAGKLDLINMDFGQFVYQFGSGIRLSGIQIAKKSQRNVQV